MAFSVATWNINSVRLRIDLVCRVLEKLSPDVLCLQETKCPQGQFPSGPLKELGYAHVAEFGQKGYHGVAIVSRFALENQSSHDFCGKGDCRHVAADVVGPQRVRVHSFYVPAGGDEADPNINEKFDHKLKFLAEMKNWSVEKARGNTEHAILAGDLNIAPYPEDVWSHKDLLKVVSHTPIETEGLIKVQTDGGWHDVVRQHVPLPEKLYTWWSYRAKDWQLANRGRRLDHVWASEGLAKNLSTVEIFAEARGWEKCSDHVPVIARFEI
jgi:exodeoxyribonuclease III